MEKGRIYKELGVLSKQGAVEALAKLKSGIKWKENCKILDVGCGPGNVTYDYLLPLLPKSTKEIMGIDISTDYIDYARLHYGHNSILSYKLMDVVKDEVPRELEGHFDYAVSLLCFQQIGNHEAAFQKIKKMLKPGGEIMCYFPTSTKSTDIFDCLAKQEKWKSYLANYRSYCSPYKDSANVEGDVRAFLTNMGFRILFCDYEEKRYNFLDKNLPSAMKALSYEQLKVPDELSEEFEIEAAMAFRSLHTMKTNQENEKYYECSYKLVTFHALKEE